MAHLLLTQSKYFVISAETTCAATQFTCNNKRCIPYVWHCDNDDDCGDLSDEPADCVDKTCREDYIKCKLSGRCIPKTWMCDGDRDCPDGDSTDEPESCG